MNKSQNSRKTNLFIILGGIFLTNAILAEIIGVKIFSGEKTLGFEPVNWTFFGEFVLDFNLTAGAIIWPVVFITTDIINVKCLLKPAMFTALIGNNSDDRF